MIINPIAAILAEFLDTKWSDVLGQTIALSEKYEAVSSFV